MKRLVTLLSILLIVVPLCLWGLFFIIGSLLPEKQEVVGLSVPRPTPRAGYEIIFPDVYAMGPDKGTFYYVSNKRQIIYRYDADRYLELQGENCEGLIWYHDDANNVHTRIDEFYFTADRLPKFNYFNPGKGYIGIPAQDLSAVMFSLDGGKSFIKGKVTAYAAVPGEEIDRFIGVDDEPLTLSYSKAYRFETHQKPITISSNTGYFILKNNNVLFGATVYYTIRTDTSQTFYSLNTITNKHDFDADRDFGEYWEIYHNPPYIERIEGARNIKVEPYQGWDKIRCEIGAER